MRGSPQRDLLTGRVSSTRPNDVPERAATSALAVHLVGHGDYDGRAGGT